MEVGGWRKLTLVERVLILLTLWTTASHAVDLVHEASSSTAAGGLLALLLLVLLLIASRELVDEIHDGSESECG